MKVSGKMDITIEISVLFYLGNHVSKLIFDDLIRTVRTVQGIVERHYGAEASNIGIQDGRDAGQSVAHVHVHILPRRLN